MSLWIGTYTASIIDRRDPKPVQVVDSMANSLGPLAPGRSFRLLGQHFKCSLQCRYAIPPYVVVVTPFIQNMDVRIIQSWDQASATCVDQSSVVILQTKDVSITADGVDPA